MILNGYRPMPTGTTAGWKKAKYPLFEPALNTMFDSYVIKEDGIYKMWFSWRPTKSIMYTTSTVLLCANPSAGFFLGGG